MRTAAGEDDWRLVDRLLGEAQVQFAENPWVASMLGSMHGIAQSRSRERMMKESMYSATRLHSRLADKSETADLLSVQESICQPAYLRRKSTQGKADR